MGRKAHCAQVAVRTADSVGVTELMRGVIDRVGDVEWRTAVRYSAVSVAGIVCTQLLLVLGHAVVGLGPATANTVAVLGASLPVYWASRAWVWKVTGPNSIRREVLPFWTFTLLGLLLSTMVVAGVGSLTESTVALTVANVSAFGVLWVAKFFVLDGVVFNASGSPAVLDRREELLVA